MAKKKKELVVNSDNLEVQNLHLNDISIRSMIRVIRGQQVMLDFELAMLYGVETRALNQAVKRNAGRFPDDFMFQLSKSEFESFRSQIVTSNFSDNQEEAVLTSQNVILKKYCNYPIYW